MPFPYTFPFDFDPNYYPVVTVEAAFSTGPKSTPSWEDITPYTRSIATRRGRQFELDRVEAGTAILEVKNLDRRFDPTYTGSPYYPYVLPMRRIRVKASWSGITYSIFTGFVEKWPQAWPGMKSAQVAIQTADGFKVFALAKLNTTFGSQASGARVAAVADAIGWPAADRSIDTGQSTLQGVTLADKPGLQHLQDVVYSENGRLFIRADGALVFQDRHAIYKAPYDTSQATFGDGGGSELPFADAVIDYGDTQIWNEVRATRVGGTTQVAQDTTSQDNYFPRTLPRDGLLVTSDSEALASAQWLCSRYKDPGLRFTQVLIKGARDPINLWPKILGLDMGQRITMKRRPPGGGAAIVQDCYIEGINHNIDFTKKDWKVVWRLSPAVSDSVWILDSLNNSVLDSTTKLAY